MVVVTVAQLEIVVTGPAVVVTVVVPPAGLGVIPVSVMMVVWAAVRPARARVPSRSEGRILLFASLMASGCLELRDAEALRSTGLRGRISGGALGEEVVEREEDGARKRKRRRKEGSWLDGEDLCWL